MYIHSPIRLYGVVLNYLSASATDTYIYMLHTLIYAEARGSAFG
jgi:hypothetical protein